MGYIGDIPGDIQSILSIQEPSNHYTKCGYRLRFSGGKPKHISLYFHWFSIGFKYISILVGCLNMNAWVKL